MDEIVYSPSKDVSRLNYGIRFGYLLQVDVATTSWFHSFAVEMPNVTLLKSYVDTLVPKTPMSTVWNRSMDTSSGLVSAALETIMKDCMHALDHERMTGHLLNTHQWCDRHAPYLRSLVSSLADSVNMINQQMQQVQILMPKQQSADGMVKRAPLEFLGDLGSSLFGTATEKQLSVVNTHVQQLAATLKSQTKTVAKVVSDMSSLTKDTQARIDNLVAWVKTSAMSGVQELAQTIRASEMQHQFSHYALRRTVDINHVMAKLIMYYDKWIDSFEQLLAGRLPSALVSMNMLTSAMETVTHALAQSQQYNLRLIITEPKKYYSQAKFVYGVYHNHLVITMQFDLTPYKPFEIFKVESWQYMLPANHSTMPTVLELRNTPAAIAVTKARDKAFQLSMEEYLQIKLFHTTIIHHRVVREPMASKPLSTVDCLLAIFMDDVQMVKALCAFTLTTGSSPQNIQRISEDGYLLTGINVYWITCTTPGHQEKRECQAQCIVHLPSGCVLVTPGWTVGATVIQAGRNVSSHAPQYVVSKPLLLSLLNQEELVKIKADATFALPPRIKNFPTLKFYEHKEQEFIAKDENLRFSLAKTMERAKANEFILHSMADSIMLRSDDVPVPWPSWLAYISFATTGLTVVLIGPVFYFCYKTRALALQLAIVQQAVLRNGVLAISMHEQCMTMLSVTNESLMFKGQGHGNHYGNNVTLRDIYLTVAAQRTFVDVARPLPAGILQQFHFFIHPAGIGLEAESARVHMQIWRPRNLLRLDFQLVYDQLVVLQWFEGAGVRYTLDLQQEVGVENGDLIGWTFEGQIGMISFQYAMEHRTYFYRYREADLPKVGRVYNFDPVFLPSIFSVAVQLKGATLAVTSTTVQAQKVNDRSSRHVTSVKSNVDNLQTPAQLASTVTYSKTDRYDITNDDAADRADKGIIEPVWNVGLEASLGESDDVMDHDQPVLHEQLVAGLSDKYLYIVTTIIAIMMSLQVALLVRKRSRKYVQQTMINTEVYLRIFAAELNVIVCLMVIPALEDELVFLNTLPVNLTGFRGFWQPRLYLDYQMSIQNKIMSEFYTVPRTVKVGWLHATRIKRLMARPTYATAIYSRQVNAMKKVRENAEPVI